MSIDELIEEISKYLSPTDIEMIKKAYEFAKEAHDGQFRKSGEEYIHHPVSVAGILANLQMDGVTIVAALLHDVIEDTEVTSEQLQEEFGKEVTLLVEGVTKLKKITYKSLAEQQAENHRKMFVAMAKDIRVILIKLADRLHNMRTLKHVSENKQKRIAEETLEIFAPLAHRLGISTIKWELEDIALRYLNPQQYYRIVNLMKQKRAEREENLNKAIEMIREKIAEVGIEAEISGRPKHIYSIYRKMFKKKKEFNQIYDLLAIRIVVNTVRDCYAALGIIHTCWKPMPGRFKDYIAMPKTNMYQSLHTTLISYRGEPLEVQIRTTEMHRTAELGIAAHWSYKEEKEAKNQSKDAFEEKLTWFRDVLESQQDANDAQEFMESLKMDLFSDLVFVFSPKGDVYELPAGSVPIDFAYRVHTEVGNRTVGAKVNGKIVTLDYVLKTGDIVEILTSKTSYGPSRDWSKIAKSSHAKSKIKQFFKKEKREESITKGRELVDVEIKKHGYDLKKVLTEENILTVAKKFNFAGEEDMFAAVGYAGITAAQIVTRLSDKVRKEKKEEEPPKIPEVKPTTKKKKLDHGVRVKGIDNLLIRFSRCCNPVPGDEIIGFVTRGRGVSVHRANCANLQVEDAENRLLPVEWEGDRDQNYSVDIEITGMDRRGLLNEVMQAVSETKTNIVAVSGRSDKHKMTFISMTISIHNVDDLHKVVERIKRVRDIFSVQRVMH